MKHILHIVAIVLITFCFNGSAIAQTQTNLALSAASTHSGGGNTAFNYGPDEYNDGVISNCGSTPWGWVSTNGWIEYRWTTAQLVGKVIFYKDNRPMRTCTIQYWDGTQYQNIMNYNNSVTCIDSVTFPTVTTTRLRFFGVGGSSNPNHREIEVYSGIIPCTGTPVTSVDAPTQVCPDRPFTLSLAGLQITSGLSFSWEYSDNGTSWGPFTGPVTPIGGRIIDSITASRWYRCTVKCISSNQSYQTTVHKVDIAPFYYCYCLSQATTKTGIDIGNVTVSSMQSGATLLNNGNPLPSVGNTAASRSYTEYSYQVQPFTIYRDSSYEFRITEMTSGPAFETAVVTAFIDFNRDGEYDTSQAAGERIFTEAILGTNNPRELAIASMKVPTTAKIGLTGMRIILGKQEAETPCANVVVDGEVEDYIVRIDFRPCDGPVKTGTISISDSALCPAYDYVVTGDKYEQERSAFDRGWQVSADNINWFEAQNSRNKDTLNKVFTGQPLYYRLRAVCPVTDDTTYSQPEFINAKDGYKCYCYSKANGGIGVDSSDIGGITVGDFNSNSGGPHVSNPNATRPRTDYTDAKPLEFFTDSIYRFTVYHTLPVIQHGDAKITVFVDFNNNKQYDIPDERIFTGFTSVGGHTLVDDMVIPYNVITDVPTGMRFVLNNEVGPNVPSDEACGPYTSGETEDIMVIFRRRFPTSVAGVSNKLDGFGLYPNPTTGKFHIQFNTASKIADIKLRISNVTGQQIFEATYKHDGGTFNKALSLEGQPSGVYFVELQADGQKLLKKLIID